MPRTADKVHVREVPEFPSRESMKGPYVVSEDLSPGVTGFPSQSFIQERLNQTKSRTGEVLMSTTRLIVEVSREAKEQAVDAFTNLASASSRVTRTARTRFVEIKKDRPLQLLAVIGGMALMVGVVARIWRSRRHA
jgi:hypothetical protein